MPNVNRQRNYGVFLIIASIVGFLASFELVVDKIEKLKNPSTVLSCDISPFVSCGKLMENWQSELFGFPNQLLGIVAFSIALFYGVLMVSKVSMPKWIHIGFNIGTLLGAVFITWLSTQSLFVIHSLCVWCIVVWACHIPIFVFTTVRNMNEGLFGKKAKNLAFFKPTMVPVLIVVLWYLIIFASVVLSFFNEFYMMLR